MKRILPDLDYEKAKIENAKNMNDIAIEYANKVFDKDCITSIGELMFLEKNGLIEVDWDTLKFNSINKK